MTATPIPTLSPTGSLVNNRPRIERVLTCHRALLETSQILNRTADFHELLQVILSKMLEISQADSAIMVFTDEAGGFQFIGGYNSHHKVLNEGEVRVSQTIVERLYESLDIVCVRDVARDPVLRNDMDLAVQYLGAVIAAPMLRGDTVLGIVHLGSRGAMPWIDDLDLATLKSMAAQLSLATDNAIALDEVRRLNEAVEGEVQNRTEQLAEANNWLATKLQQVESELATQTGLQKTRSRFFSALAHELRAPVQLLLGHAYLALEDGTGNLNSLQHNSLTVILKTCEHLQNLVSKVMDAGKLEDGGMAVAPMPLDVRPLIDETVKSSRGFLKGKPVELTAIYPADLANAVADGTRVHQVLLNLLTNACRFTDKGTIIVSASASDGYITISVADTGTGIPQDKLDVIFEPYVQVDTLRSKEGAGLGLAISKQLIELHGGRLWATSKVGAGSTFSFTLPIELS